MDLKIRTVVALAGCFIRKNKGEASEELAVSYSLTWMVYTCDHLVIVHSCTFALCAFI